MVDSIVFRIHDLIHHERLRNHLDNVAQKQVTKITKFGEEEYDQKKAFFIVNYYKDAATGREVEVGGRGHLKSSHYDCALAWNNYGRGYVEFNLSLPKYWFGNNVAQLVDHYLDPHYFHMRNNPFWHEQSKEYAWKRFSQVLNHFIATMLGGEMKDGGYVDKNMLEIMRIDLCFNLTFNNEQDSDYYLEEIRSVRKKGMHESTSKALDYDGAVYFPSKNVTLKIYQKGKEFKKHSYKQVLKRYGQHEADRLQRTANCMLRFEVEFRKGGMTDAFFSLLKIKKHPAYTPIRMARSVSAHGYFSKDGVKYNFDGLDNKAAGGRYRKMDIEDRRRLAIGQKIFGKSISFFAHRTAYGSIRDIQPEDIVKQYDHREVFNEDLFFVLVNRFQLLIHQFKLGNLNNMLWLSELLTKSRNEKEFQRQYFSMKGYRISSNGISSSKLQLIYGYLQEYTWKEIEQKKLMPKRTLTRYKKFFNDHGLAEKNTKMNFKVDFTFASYFDAFSSDFYLVNKRTTFF